MPANIDTNPDSARRQGGSSWDVIAGKEDQFLAVGNSNGFVQNVGVRS
jgi:hypothetical protein